jgi:hypothetical protein
MRPTNRASSTLNRSLLLPRAFQAAEGNTVARLEDSLLDDFSVHRRAIGASGVAQHPTASVLCHLGMMPRDTLVVYDNIVIWQSTHPSGRSKDRIRLVGQHQVRRRQSHRAATLWVSIDLGQNSGVLKLLLLGGLHVLEMRNDTQVPGDHIIRRLQSDDRPAHHLESALPRDPTHVRFQVLCQRPAHRLELRVVLGIEENVVNVRDEDALGADRLLAVHCPDQSLADLDGLKVAARGARKGSLHQPFDEAFETRNEIHALL